MKEYRIKARSAENRRAIIGALEGVGARRQPLQKIDDCDFDDWPIVSFVEGSCWYLAMDGYITHTSLDALLEDIERDRKTVEVEMWPGNATVGSGEIKFHGLNFSMCFETFDRIAEAVNKVRHYPRPEDIDCQEDGKQHVTGSRGRL